MNFEGFSNTVCDAQATSTEAWFILALDSPTAIFLNFYDRYRFLKSHTQWHSHIFTFWMSNGSECGKFELFSSYGHQAVKLAGWRMKDMAMHGERGLWTIYDCIVQLHSLTCCFLEDRKFILTFNDYLI